ncbi:MAG: UDP-3-O-(3-hydroxymyristoyl)glucosamine N-acyltransferase [Alistipes sp.]|jgi:UDP-3-O-[3-hydroxymyristoyl] glucosamine N-acyltransferase|nr:UDP-3-O-(3-hydroxymyristoyl)glucosamine N-acyltransferase [Alistipes sp.]
MQFTAEAIAEFLGGEVAGDPGATVGGFAPIEKGQPGALSFLANPKYEQYVYTTDSTVVIVGGDFKATGPVAATLVRVPDAYAAFASLLRLYDEARPRPAGVSPRASVAEDAVVGEKCYVGDFAVVDSGAVLGDGALVYPQSYVGRGVKIGAGSTIHAGVKIYEGCVIGERVVIHAGSVIGADGFGFAPGGEGGAFGKIPQIGNVVVEDDVEIGANTCVDRATMGSTVLRRGVKLDNLIQVGHNVEIGENTVAAAQTGIAGSVKIGAGCMFGGQAGIAGHITLGDGVRMGAQSGVDHDVEPGGTLLGSPGMPGIRFHRSWAVFRQLPELSRRVNELEKTLSRFGKVPNRSV